MGVIGWIPTATYPSHGGDRARHRIGRLGTVGTGVPEIGAGLVSAKGYIQYAVIEYNDARSIRIYNERER